MSHFTRIRTQIRDIPSLVAALADLGFATVEVHDMPQPLFGYQGDARTDTAEVIVRRQYVGSLSNDMGFKRQADGSLIAIISDYDRHRYAQTWLNHLTQRYSYHRLKTQAPQEGFAIEAEETLADGTLRLVIGRWV